MISLTTSLAVEKQVGGSLHVVARSAHLATVVSMHVHNAIDEHVSFVHATHRLNAFSTASRLNPMPMSCATASSDTAAARVHKHNPQGHIYCS
jgi:hypothetical protein